jgi:anti-sigma factor RsiW
MAMTACEFQHRVTALYDGELDDLAARRVRAHVDECPTCAAELAALEELSARITADLAALGEADAAAIAVMHDAVDRAAAAPAEANLIPLPLFRTAGLLGALAASVLIVAGVWLLDAPRRSRLAGGELTAPGAADELVAIPPDWERVATTLRAQPRLGVLGDDSPFAPHYAAAIDWMLDGLLPPPAVPNEAKSWSGPRSF